MYSVPASPPAILPSAFIENVTTSTPILGAIQVPAATVSVTLPSAPASLALGNGSDTEDKNNSDVSIPTCPISVPHLVWKANVIGNDDFPLPVDCLLDSGAHLVLIRPEVVADLRLPVKKLRNPVSVSLALNGVNTTTSVDNCVTLSISMVNNAWTSRTVTAIIAPGLCTNILLGLPFHMHNKIIIDHEKHTVIHRPLGFNILNEHALLPRNEIPKQAPHKKHLILVQLQKYFLKELKWRCAERLQSLEQLLLFKTVAPVNVISAVKATIELLAHKDKLIALETELKSEFNDIFEPIPHVNELPMSETAQIQLKDAYKTISTRTYPYLCQYKEAFQKLL